MKLMKGHVVTLLTSYCDENNNNKCTDRHPCSRCIAMCNQFELQQEVPVKFLHEVGELTENQMAKRMITFSLFKLMVEFEGKSGKKPTSIYLGSKTIELLFREINPDLVIEDVTFKPTRPRFNNIPIFEVDEEEYMAVG